MYINKHFFHFFVAAVGFVALCVPFFGGLLGFFGGLAFTSTSYIVSLSNVISHIVHLASICVITKS